MYIDRHQPVIIGLTPDVYSETCDKCFSYGMNNLYQLNK